MWFSADHGFFLEYFCWAVEVAVLKLLGSIMGTPLAGRLWFQIPLVSGEVVKERKDKGECGGEQRGVLCQAACPREIHTGALSRD